MNTSATNSLKGKRGVRRVLHAARYSCDGFTAAFCHEAAFRQLVVLHSVLIVMAFCIDLELNTRLILLCASLVSLIVELFNSAIEAVVDDISLDIRPLAKRAKDMGSAAQMLALTLVAVLWLMICIE